MDQVSDTGYRIYAEANRVREFKRKKKLPKQFQSIIEEHGIKFDEDGEYVTLPANYSIKYEIDDPDAYLDLYQGDDRVLRFRFSASRSGEGKWTLD